MSLFPPDTIKPLHSPKGAEAFASSSRVMVRAAVVVPRVILPGQFIITNLTVSGGMVTLQWQSTGTVQVIASADLVTWAPQGAPTTGTSATFPASGPQRFFRLQQVSPLGGGFATRLGGPLNDAVTGIAACPDGSFVACGYFKGTSNFGSGTLTSAGGADIFIAKVDASGEILWAARYGSTGDEVPNSIAVAPDGRIFLCGTFTGSANLGGATFTNAGGYDAFIAGFNPDASPRWSYAYGKAGNDNFNRLAITPAGQVVAAGSFLATGSTPINFGTPGHPGAPLYSTYPNQSISLAAFTLDGDYAWSELLDNGGDSYANGLAVDGAGNIVIAGEFKGYLQAGIVTLHDKASFQNSFIIKAGPLGQLPPFSGAWAVTYGSTQAQRATALAIDHNGDAVIGGMFYQVGDFGAGQVTGTAIDEDVYVARYSGADGSHLWSKAIKGNYGAWINSVACDSHNNVFATGQYYGSFDFGGSTAGPSQALSNDIFLARYNPDGSLAWVKSYGGQSPDAGNSVTVDASDNPWLGGYFGLTGSFPPFGSLVSAGGADGFVLRLSP